MEEINEVLNELKEVKPEKLTGEAKRLFEAIMKIADERDELEYKYNRAIEDLIKLEKERQADKEKIKELEYKLNEEAYIRVSAGAHNRICELEKENKRLYEENQIYALEGSRVQLQIHIEKNYIPKAKVIENRDKTYKEYIETMDKNPTRAFILKCKLEAYDELLKDGGE